MKTSSRGTTYELGPALSAHAQLSLELGYSSLKASARVCTCSRLFLMVVVGHVEREGITVIDTKSLDKLQSQSQQAVSGFAALKCHCG